MGTQKFLEIFQSHRARLGCHIAPGDLVEQEHFAMSMSIAFILGPITFIGVVVVAECSEETENVSVCAHRHPARVPSAGAVLAGKHSGDYTHSSSRGEYQMI